MQFQNYIFSYIFWWSEVRTCMYACLSNERTFISICSHYRKFPKMWIWPHPFLWHVPCSIRNIHVLCTHFWRQTILSWSHCMKKNEVNCIEPRVVRNRRCVISCTPSSIVSQIKSQNIITTFWPDVTDGYRAPSGWFVIQRRTRRDVPSVTQVQMLTRHKPTVELWYYSYRSNWTYTSFEEI